MKVKVSLTEHQVRTIAFEAARRADDPTELDEDRVTWAIILRRTRRAIDFLEAKKQLLRSRDSVTVEKDDEG